MKLDSGVCEEGKNSTDLVVFRPGDLLGPVTVSVANLRPSLDLAPDVIVVGLELEDEAGDELLATPK